MEAVDELGHDLARVVTVLGRHHADKEHDALDQSRVLEVQIDDQALEDVLVLLDQILRKLLEQLRVPLDDSLLFLAALPLDFIVLFLEPVENMLELVSVGQNGDHSPQQSAVDVLDEFFAVDITDFLRVLQTQDGRDDVRELLRVHLAQQRVRVHVQVLRFVFSQVVKVKAIRCGAVVLSLHVIASRADCHQALVLLGLFDD